MRAVRGKSVATVGVPDSRRLGQTLWVDATAEIAGADGSPGSPFTTIQAALNRIGLPTDVADQKVRWTVMIASGEYDEDLTVPAGRRVTLLPLGPVTLGDGAVDSDFVSTTPRSITVDLTPAFGGRAAFSIGTVTPGCVFGSRCTQANAFDVSGDLIFVGAPTVAEAAVVRLSMLRVRGDLNGAGVTAPAADVHLFACRLDGAFLGGGLLAIIAAVRSSFHGAVTALIITHAQSCAFSADVTVALLPTAGGVYVLPPGFYGCEFESGGHTFTGPPLSAFLDAASNFWFKTNGWALGGGATKTMIFDSVP